MGAGGREGSACRSPADVGRVCKNFKRGPLMTASSPIARHIVRFVALIFSLALSTAIFAAPPGTYTVTNLVADPTGPTALNTDPNLVNGWGIALRPTSPFWIAANETSM